MNTEAMAQAMFEKLHAMNHRPRNWRNHPDGDFDVELGRETFRAMAEAAAAVAKPEPVESTAFPSFNVDVPMPSGTAVPPAVEAEPVAAEVAPVAANDAAPVEPGAA